MIKIREFYKVDESTILDAYLTVKCLLMPEFGLRAFGKVGFIVKQRRNDQQKIISLNIQMHGKYV